MSAQNINYECVRGHVTTIKAGAKVSVAIRCTCLREDGKVCKESAYYQPTWADQRNAAIEDEKALSHIDYEWLDSLHADENPY